MEDTPYYSDLSGLAPSHPGYLPLGATPGDIDNECTQEFDHDNLSRSPPWIMGDSPGRGLSISENEGDGDGSEDGQPKKKRQRNSGASSRNRTTFTKEQTAQLEEIYLKKKYLELDERDVVAEQVGLAPKKVMIWFQNKRMRVKALRKKAGLGPEEIDPDELPTHMQKRGKPEPKCEQTMSPCREAPSPSFSKTPMATLASAPNNAMPMPMPIPVPVHLGPGQTMNLPENPGIGTEQMANRNNSMVGNTSFTGILEDKTRFNVHDGAGNQLRFCGNSAINGAPNSPMPLPPMADRNGNQYMNTSNTPSPQPILNAAMNAPLPLNINQQASHHAADTTLHPPVTSGYGNNPQAFPGLHPPQLPRIEPQQQFFKQDLKNKIVARSRRLSEASNKSEDSSASLDTFKTMTTLTANPSQPRFGPIAPSGSFLAPIPRPVFSSAPQPPPEKFPAHHPYSGDGLLSYLSGMLPPLLPPYQTRPPMVPEST